MKLLAGQIQIWPTCRNRPAGRKSLLLSPKKTNPQNQQSGKCQARCIDCRALIRGQVGRYIEFTAVIVEALHSPVLCLWPKQLFPLCCQIPATLEQKPLSSSPNPQEAKNNHVETVDTVYICRCSEMKKNMFCLILRGVHVQTLWFELFHC